MRSTAWVAVVRGTELTVANVGDSRGVLCDMDGKSHPLSFDHKPHVFVCPTHSCVQHVLCCSYSTVALVSPISTMDVYRGIT